MSSFRPAESAQSKAQAEPLVDDGDSVRESEGATSEFARHRDWLYELLSRRTRLNGGDCQGSRGIEMARVAVPGRERRVRQAR